MCGLSVVAGLLLVFCQLPPVGVAVDLVLQLLPERLRGRRLLGVRGDGVDRSTRWAEEGSTFEAFAVTMVGATCFRSVP